MDIHYFYGTLHSQTECEVNLFYPITTKQFRVFKQSNKNIYCASISDLLYYFSFEFLRHIGYK